MAIVISGVNNNDKITASDGTIDLLSGVNYVGVLTAPAFTSTGNLTAASINVGSGIQLGNAGVATATTFVGNLTGNVNATSNLLLQIGGSEKLRVASSGQIGLSGANYGTSGQVLTSQGSGNAATWSTINSDKISEGNTEAEVVDTGSDGHFKVTTEGSERLRITSGGDLRFGLSTVANATDSAHYIMTLTGKSGQTGAGAIAFRDPSANTDGFIFADSGNLFITADYDNTTADSSIRFRVDGSSEKLRITSGGQVVQYTNHTSGASAHQNTGWYGDDANHYTLEYKDFNEIRAVKTDNNSGYNSIVYKREMMTEYCDIEFTLKGSSSNSQRHLGFIINGDGSDTSSNFDRLVFRSVPGTTSSNQIRLDKGAGGTGFTETSSSIPTFFDGNERHIHIQIRKRTFSITVNRMGQSEYNFNARNSADLVSPRGYFGFSIYEPSSANPEVTIRDFKITNYTQNAVPSTSVAFQVTHSGNPSKSSGTVVKPCNVEQFDNGYGGNFNTSNYRFTAPVAGMYQFGNTFNCYSSPSDMWCGFRVNGSTLFVGNKRNNNTGSGDQNVDAYAIIQLQPGDYVEAVDNTSNGVTYSSGITWNRFEGSLIAAFK